jgi:ketosteroid isomerase-like protein
MSTHGTQAVLSHHLTALTEGIDAILSDYSEDCVLFTPNERVQGLAGLRAFFEEARRHSPPDLWERARLLHQDVDGEIAYILWQAEPSIPLATDTFVVRDGKIVAQTFALLTPVQTPSRE